MLPSSREPRDKMRTRAHQDQGGTIARNGGKDPGSMRVRAGGEETKGKTTVHSNLPGRWRRKGCP